MSHAAQHPTFDSAGAPISVLLDFDGTISLADVGDALLGALVEDQSLVRHMDELYVAGSKGSRELIAWDMEVLPRDAAVLLREVDALPLDESLRDLVETVQAVGGAIEIVSDGIGFHVERMLAGAGLADLPVATNRSELGLGADGVSFPYGHAGCLVCGTCKRERIRRTAMPDEPSSSWVMAPATATPPIMPTWSSPRPRWLPGVRSRASATNPGSGSPTWPNGSSWHCWMAVCRLIGGPTTSGRRAPDQRWRRSSAVPRWMWRRTPQQLGP